MVFYVLKSPVLGSWKWICFEVYFSISLAATGKADVTGRQDWTVYLRRSVLTYCAEDLILSQVCCSRLKVPPKKSKLLTMLKTLLWNSQVVRGTDSSGILFGSDYSISLKVLMACIQYENYKHPIFTYPKLLLGWMDLTCHTNGLGNHWPASCH